MSDQHQQSTPAVVQQTTVINVGNRKSVGGAVLLALFFGPIGMIYATPVGALVMFFVNLVVGIPTLGLGLILTVPAGAIWAGIAASNHNSALGTVSTQAVAHHATPAASQAASAPAGWHPDPDGSDRLRYWDGSRWTDQYASQEAEVPVISAASAEEATAASATEGPTASLADPEQPKAAFCSSCGEKVGETDKFCGGCGTRREPVS